MANRRGHRQFGSIRKERSGRWMARVPITDSGGKSRSIGTFATRREAEDALALERSAMVTGTWVDPDRGNQTLADFAAAFIETNGYRERSRALNARLLAEWIAARLIAEVRGRQLPIDLGSRPLRSIEPQDVRLWFSAVRAESRRRAVERHTRVATSTKTVNAAIRAWARTARVPVASTGRIPAVVRQAWEDAGGPATLVRDVRPTAGATEAAQAYRLLHAVLERARVDGLIRTNPAAIERAGSVATLERRPATVAELRTAAEAMPDRYQAAVWVAAMTSVRSGELFALRRRDYDPNRRTLRIERAVELEGSAEAFGQVKASSSLREVVVPQVAANALEAHLKRFTGRGPDSLIFTTSTGGVVYPARIGPHWAKARAQAGRDDLRWHDLRHTGQSLAAAAGAGIKELQARAGHSTTTAAVRYLHRVQDDDRRLAAAMDELVERDANSHGGS